MRWSLCLLTLSLAAAAGAPKPNFSGAWELNLTRSDFGNQTPPKKLFQKITQNDKTLTLEQSEVSPLDQSVKFECTYTTDGKPVTNTVLGSTVQAIARWEGDELLVSSWTEYAGRKVEIKDRWRLTENGTTLIVVRQASGPGGNFEQTLVSDKKAPDKK